MKNLIILLTALILVLCNAFSHSQDKNHQNDANNYFYSASDGDASNPTLTTTPHTNSLSPEKEQLISQLNAARLSGDDAAANELQSKLNRMNGEEPVEFVNNPSITGMPETVVHFDPEHDGISTIGTAGYWAIATQTSKWSNLIFAAVTEYVPSAGDQLKIYVSYNLGVSWVLKGAVTNFNNGFRFYNDELDIEPIITPTDTLLYVVAGYVYYGQRATMIAQCDIRTQIIYLQSWSLSISTTKNYGARITSDNTQYNLLPYVYITVANDSVRGVNNHSLKQRFCVIMNPLQHPFMQTHKIATQNTGGFFWGWNGASDTTWMWQDIGYYRNGTTDVVYSACIFRGLNNIYNAWSQDYGSTITSNLDIIETMPTRNVRLAFNSAAPGTLTTGSIVYLRNWTSNPNGDVDVRCQNTLTGGTDLSSFTASYPEFSTDTATSCDIQAVKGAYNKFKYAYSVRGDKCYYLSNTSVSSYSQALQVNNIPAGADFGRVRAGYRIAPTDSCLSVWSGSTGAGMYSTYGCDNYTGIHTEGQTVPQGFSLSQNYPNPFNPSTTIKFGLPNSAFVKLVVYDITGRQVAMLVNNNLQAGSYRFDFNASHLASGVYFYLMDAGDFKEIKKMMLVK